jgi:cobaltochelatase CobN
MRTGGDDIAQALALMGVRPKWDEMSGRVTGFEVIPEGALGRPRVDVTLRISGFFRDAFPMQVDLLASAARTVMELDESPDQNPAAARFQAEGGDDKAAFRVFGSKPGAYGAGLQAMIDERLWADRGDLAKAFVSWGGYAYGAGSEGGDAHEAFRQRLSHVEAVVQNQDNREHDILDSDDYYQFQGGMANAVRNFGDRAPEIYHGDHANPSAPRIRSLKEEINRVMRSRVVNPKWIQAAQRHGYKGAFEMSATVDYLFAYDATTSLVDDYQYEMLATSYLYDQLNQAFLQAHNPNAMKDIAERLIEAMQRGLWQEPGEHQQKIEQILLQVEDALERAES